MADDLIVVVPGIMGSVLRRPGGADLWNRSVPAISRGLRDLSATFGALRLPEKIGDEAPDPRDALEPAGLINGWHVWPGFHAGAGYHGLTAQLRRRHPGAVRFFPYDWRLSNRHTARLLAAQVDRWLGELDRPGARVTFVCHSMGGLVVRYFLEVLGGRDRARKVITLGTPYSGSVKAIRTLTGDAYARLPAVGAALTEAARSFPSLHQLLPAYRCVETPDGMRALAEHPLADLDSDAVRDGAALHAEIAAAVARNGPAPYDLHVLAGKRQKTWQSVRDDGTGRRVYQRSQRGVDHRGDGTVATFAAVPPEWDDTAAAALIAVRHSSFTCDAGALETVAEKLSPIELGSVLLPACELAVDLPEFTRAADGIELTVEADRDDLLLHAIVADPTTGDVVAERPVTADGRGVVIRPPAGLWQVTVRAVAEVPPVEVSDIVWVVD